MLLSLRSGFYGADRGLPLHMSDRPRTGLRRLTATGTLVNGTFLAGLSALNLVRGFVLAHFLTREDYGIWGVILISLATLLWLKQAGIGDKYIQQEDPDQEEAFQRAFTLEALYMGAFALLLAAAIPVMALVYNRTDIVAPAVVFLALLPAMVLQAPLWVFYRRMDFVQQRLVQAVDPVLGFVVGVALAVAGAGYWSFVGGALAGAWGSALVAIARSPYALRFRYDPGTLRRYASFSWPLVLAGGAGVVTAQGAVITSNAHLGIEAVGALTLAASISQFTDRVDQIVTGTLYPAICAVADRTALLHESFVKSNRLALMWAVPFGLGLALFAADLVHFGIGDRWVPAIALLQWFGVIAAANHLGFNWDAYFRARGDTRPIAVASVVAIVAFAGAAIPLILSDGLEGLAIGLAIQAACVLAVRGFFLRRLFAGFALGRHALRAVAPSLPAAGAVALARALESGPRSEGRALGELALYVLVTAVATLVLERDLLREARGYLARPAPAA
jgi:O-antigen/teichoic acid export membrane protein